MITDWSKPKKIIFVLGALGLLASVILLLPFIRTRIVSFAEIFIVQRELQRPDKWMAVLLTYAILGVIASILLLVVLKYAELLLVVLKYAETKLFLLCGLFGVVFFITTFGTAVLDVTNTGWLIAPEDDLSINYIGWRLFRESPWYFPIGLMDNLIHPFKVSIIYTDSIPLFAIFFKTLSPILPKDFQYMGIFGLLVWFLQGGVAALIIQKLCKNNLFSALGSMFFIFSTTMMQRIYSHVALTSHFLILLCIYAYLCCNAGQSLRRNLVVWGGLFVLGVSLHMYFVPILFIFMIASAVKNYLKTRQLRGNIILCGASLLILFVTMFILGAFYSGADKGESGLGFYSMNINALYNPYPYISSYFLNRFPLATGGQYEGFGYLGFGVLLGCFFIVCFALLKIREANHALQNMEIKRNCIILVAVFLFFFLFALSPVITFNDKELVRLHIIPVVERFWSTFRSSGRYVWVLQYMIICGMLVAIKKIFGVKKGLLFLSVLLAFQYLDIKDFFSQKGRSYKERTVWVSPLIATEWDTIVDGKRHLFFVEGNFAHSQYHQFFYPLMDFALLHGLTLNDSYMARRPSQLIERQKIEEKARMLAGNVNGEMIYLFETMEQADYYRAWLDILTLDGIVIGIKK